MDKHEVIEAFCKLSREVMEKKFNFIQPADCFCNPGAKPMGSYQFSTEIMQFIENAVRKELDAK